MSPQQAGSDVFLTPKALLAHWQGHRRLTRRVIEAFPDDKFGAFSVGGMRPFAVMAVELLRMAAPTVRGVLTDKWEEGLSRDTLPKAEVLKLWDQSTKEIDALWPKIPAARFAETVKAYGQWEMPARDIILYVVDNEIHHRAQGYVYLRALGIEPPHFWERE